MNDLMQSEAWEWKGRKGEQSSTYKLPFFKRFLLKNLLPAFKK